MELCPGGLGQPQVVLIILPASPTCCTSPTGMGVCGQAVPCAPAEQLMCSGDARQKAGVLHAPTSSCSTQSSGVPHREGHGCAGATESSCCLQRLPVCVSVWEVLGRNRSWAEPAASTGHQTPHWGLVKQPCAMGTPAPGMASRSSLISCIRTTSPCSSSPLALVISWKRLSVRPTSSTPMSTWCPTTWASMMV